MAQGEVRASQTGMSNQIAASELNLQDTSSFHVELTPTSGMN
jgi:hypothetical protein